MRIAHLIPYRVHPYSGVLEVIVQLSRHMAERHDVEVWQLGPSWEDVDEVLAPLESAGVRRIVIPVKNAWRLGRQGHEAVAARHEVDVVHIHNAFSPLNRMVSRKLNVPYVFTPHGGYSDAVLRRHAVRKRLFRRFFELPMLNGAGLVTALTEHEKDQVRRFGRRGPVRVIPNGVEYPPVDADGTEFRRELGLEPGERLAIFVGRLDSYYKRLPEIIRGFASTSAWTLALVGPAWRQDLDSLQQLIQQLDCAERVHICGPRRGENLNAVFAAADLFILLSRSEGFSLALLSAASYGVPMLMSREVESALGVTIAGAGITATPGDLADLEGLLAACSAAEWETRREAARLFAGRFKWSDIALDYERGFLTILSGDTSRSSAIGTR